MTQPTSLGHFVPKSRVWGGSPTSIFAGLRPSKNFGVWPHPNCLPFLYRIRYNSGKQLFGISFWDISNNTPALKRALCLSETPQPPAPISSTVSANVPYYTSILPVSSRNAIPVCTWLSQHSAGFFELKLIARRNKMLPCNLYILMPQPFLNNHGLHSSVNQIRTMGMPDIMNTYLFHSCLICITFNHMLHRFWNNRKNSLIGRYSYQFHMQGQSL